MGKIVKFCKSCDEGFAEKFAFCPDCGAPLQAFEMNPLDQIESPANISLPEPEAPAFIAENVEPAWKANAGPTAEEIAFASAPTEEVPAADYEPFVEEPAIPAAAVFYVPEPMHADEPRKASPAPIYSKDQDGGYHITVIQEKNVTQRNVLLLAAAVFMCTLTIVAWGVSLFQKDLDVGSIGDDRSLARFLDDVPAVIDEEEAKKDKDDGGGGGGGGREDQEEVSQGDLADQTKTPLRSPDAKVPRLDDPLELPPASTEGNRKFPKEFDRWGDPNKFGNIASNGPGTGGGQGSGDGTGQGSGSGTGAGSGSGSGSGSGNGNRNGPGTDDGDVGVRPPPVKTVTTDFKLLYKQKAQYTDAARQNNVQGTVTLRVTFLASGGIGSISTISGLPHGLTEQAIAAARAIKFQPKTVNGVPQSVTRPVSFSFNIY